MRPILYVCLLSVLTLSSITTLAATPGNQRLEIEAKDAPFEGGPLLIPFTAPDSARPMSVTDSATGKALPASIHNGYLIVISDPIPQGGTRLLKVGTGKKTRDRVVVKDKGKKKIAEVYIDGQLFTAFYYGDDFKKPFLWPLIGEGGVSLTRDWPMGKRLRSRDHPHHRSFWSAYGDVNGVDTWGEGPNSGRQSVYEVTYGSGAAMGWIAARTTWMDTHGVAVATEDREYLFYAMGPKRRIMDLTISLTPSNGSIKLGDTKEGGFVALRVHDSLREQGGTGIITNGAGGVGAAQCWGAAAPWCDYSGLIDGFGPRGIAVFDHPSNLRHPTTWHVRDYGLMAANCFGYSYFTQGKSRGDFDLKAGETLTFHYRIVVHSGDVHEGRVARLFEDYAAPPEIHWRD